MDRQPDLPSPSPTPGQRQITVWFDGACPLCLREMALMRRLDRRGAIQFVDLTGAPLSCPRDQQTMLARLHVREGQTVLSGAAAFAALWRAIPLLRPLGELARLPGVLPLLELTYRAFLRIRPLLQRLLR